jgi:thiamine-phosphate pyrophosphorylase
MVRYAITDGVSPAPELLKHAQCWGAEGVDFVQIREKHLAAGELAALARAMLPIFSGTRTKLLVNSRADVAAAMGADGVHLTAHPDELTPEQVRRVFARAGRPAPVVSVSCHSVAEVARAAAASVDLILCGPVFEKRVPGEIIVAGVELDALREACLAASGVPVLALGGITKDNTVACLDAGAAGVAGIRLFQ